MNQIMLLVLAAVLEVGGDALIRAGLKTGGIALMVAGVAVLAGYGFLVNLTRLDFGHLMGLYIVLFFVVSQTIAVLAFRERLHPSVIMGGLLVIAGGVLMAVWQRA